MYLGLLYFEPPLRAQTASRSGCKVRKMGRAAVWLLDCVLMTDPVVNGRSSVERGVTSTGRHLSFPGVRRQRRGSSHSGAPRQFPRTVVSSGDTRWSKAEGKLCEDVEAIDNQGLLFQLPEAVDRFADGHPSIDNLPANILATQDRRYLCQHEVSKLAAFARCRRLAKGRGWRLHR